jgi:Protein kinase domain
VTEGLGRVVVGRYRLQRTLGRGGMGAVWLAHDTLLDRDVAIKEIYLLATGSGPVDPQDPLIRRALREAQAAARLRHPGIVTVHDVVTETGRPWIVMELIKGRSLAELIQQAGLLPAARTADIGIRVLDALRTAHRHGVLHRDVKPANILLDDADRVVLTDFGIAAIDDATALTATGQMVGSPAYLAPERIDGKPATAAADLWALGVTLYTAVTGHSPFQRDGTLATMAAILTSRPTAPAHAGQLWPILQGLLDKDPARRLTAEQARPLLVTAAAAGSASPGTGDPAAQRARRWRNRPRRQRFTADDIPPTISAPPPTLAATTAHQAPAPDGPAPATEPQPARPTMDGVPHWGVLPTDFPIHLVELTVGDRTGYTVRTYVADDDVVEAVFAGVAGRLRLFRRPEQATEFAVATAGHDMSEVLHWDWLSESMSRAFLPLLDDHRYDLDLPSANLEMDPARWLSDLIVKAGDVARELVLALAIEEGYALLRPGSPLDRLDDELRAARRRPRPRTVRQWQQLDRGVLAAEWEHVVDLIGSRVDWQN